MSIQTLIKEFMRLLRDNKNKIIMTSLIFLFISIGIQILISNYSENLFSEKNDVEQLNDEFELLQEVYSQEPAEFKFFAQKEDGEIFLNSFLFDEYFSSPQQVELIESQTDVNISEVLQAEKDLGLNKTSDYRGSIAAIRDMSSNVITFRVQVGNNAEENFQISKFIEEQLNNGNIPLTKNLDTYILYQSDIGEYLLGEDLLMVSSPEALNLINDLSNIGPFKFIIYGLIGLLAGFLIYSIGIVFSRLVNNTIGYAFEYTWGYDDMHFLLQKNQENFNDKFYHLTTFPNYENNIVLSWESEKLIKNIEEINISGQELKNTGVTIIIDSFKTDKKWYTTTYNFFKQYDKAVKIIHLI